LLELAADGTDLNHLPGFNVTNLKDASDSERDLFSVGNPLESIVEAVSGVSEIGIPELPSVSSFLDNSKDAITGWINAITDPIIDSVKEIETLSRSAFDFVESVKDNCFGISAKDGFDSALDDMQTFFDNFSECVTVDIPGMGEVITAAPDRFLQTFSECASGFQEVTDDLLEIPLRAADALEKCTLSGMFPKSPIFKAKANAFGSFNYETPVELVSYKKRMKPTRGTKHYGKFYIDTMPDTYDFKAEGFMLDVYEEFVGCAVSSQRIYYSLIICILEILVCSHFSNLLTIRRQILANSFNLQTRHFSATQIQQIRCRKLHPNYRSHTE